MTQPDAVLGVDLGTSAIKAGIFTLDGVQQAEGSCPIELRRLGQGHVEQDLDEFYEAFVSATRAALSNSEFDADRIGAIAIAGQMAGVGIVDADHRPLAPYDSWLDSRCGDVVRDVAANFGERIAATAGCAPTLSIGPKMMWWVRNEPEVCDRAASFVTAAGYVAGRAAGLSGEQAFIDPSYLHFTSVADVGTATWDEELAEAVGIPLHLLPRIAESTDIIGQLTAAAADELGLAAGLPVAAGCGDTAAGALGADVTDPGQAFDVAGTAAVLGTCLPSFTPDTGAGVLMTMRSALPGRWYSLAYVGDAGQVIEWACREMLGHDEADQAAFEDLAAAASKVEPGSDGVVVSPHFSGRIAPVAPDTRGAVIGLTPAHDSTHLARATLESIAFEYRGYADRADELAGEQAVRSVTGVGGGSRSRVWNQIKADVLGVPYHPVDGVESGTRGAAILAIVALGHERPDLDTTAFGPPADPDPGTRAAYDAAYERYRWWSEHLVDGYRSFAERHRGDQH